MGSTLYFEPKDPGSGVARISALLFSVKSAKIGSHNHSQLLKIASWLKSLQVKRTKTLALKEELAFMRKTTLKNMTLKLLTSLKT